MKLNKKTPMQKYYFGMIDTVRKEYENNITDTLEELLETFRYYVEKRYDERIDDVLEYIENKRHMNIHTDFIRRTKMSKAEIIKLMIIILEIVLFVLQIIFAVNGKRAESLLMCLSILILAAISNCIK